MQLPDVNVLIYAHREDVRDHEQYVAWLRALVNAPEPFALSESILSGFVRVVTNRRVFDPPTPIDIAVAFCEGLRGHQRAVVVRPGPRNWDIFIGLLEATGVRGPQVSDVYHAALAMEHDCEFVTTDAGFARFPGLRWRHPLGQG